MKAIVRDTYGSADVLRLENIEKPMPKADEVLVKVHATSLNSLDWRFLKAEPFLIRLDSGLFKPKNRILGLDVAGTVEAIGRDVKQFQIGDAVFADILDLRGGALAEYVAIPERLLVSKPSNLSFEQAAAVPLVGITAMQALEVQAQVQPGQNVLIYGASGGVGTFAVQLAKALGTEVTAVCSTRNVELVRQLGADHVIDYKREDFTIIGQQYDLILAVNGYQPLEVYQQALTPTGKYIFIGGTGKAFFQATVFGPRKSKASRKQMGTMQDPEDRQTVLKSLTALLENETVKPVIDRCYPLNETPEAFRYLAEGHAQGKIVISVNQ